MLKNKMLLTQTLQKLLSQINRANLKYIVLIGIIAIMLLVPVEKIRAENTLNFFNEDVSSVLQALARINNVNIVMDGTVTGKITINLNNISFQNALDLIARSQGLVYKNINGVIVITSMGDQKQGTDVPRYLSGVYTYRLKYISVQSAGEIIAKMLAINVPAGVYEKDKDISNDYINSSGGNNVNSIAGSSGSGNNSGSSSSTAASTGGSGSLPTTSSNNASGGDTSRTTPMDRLQIDKATNTLIFWGTTSEAGDIDKVLNKIDVPTQQVSLQAEFLEISKTASKALGVDWTWNDIVFSRLISSKSSDAEAIGSSWTGGAVAKLRALFTDGDAKILARPNVSTTNGKPAYIEIGDQVPVVQQTRNNDGTYTNTVSSYIKTGIILRYIPRINGDGTINANIYTEVSIPELITTNGLYKIKARKAGTQMKMRDGETIIIGGLINSNEVRGLSKIPFLGDIPVIGGFFRSASNTKEETEVVILLTARILPDNSNFVEENINIDDK